MNSFIVFYFFDVNLLPFCFFT